MNNDELAAGKYTEQSDLAVGCLKCDRCGVVEFFPVVSIDGNALCGTCAGGLEARADLENHGD